MKYRVQRATGAAAVAMTIAPGVAWQLESIRVHLSAGGAATDLTATVDAGAGAAYDVVLATQAMNGVTDYVYKPDFPIPFTPDDELDIAYTNGGAATYGIEVYYSAI
jgi:hypothetical protein